MKTKKIKVGKILTKTAISTLVGALIIGSYVLYEKVDELNHKTEEVAKLSVKIKKMQSDIDGLQETLQDKEAELTQQSEEHKQALIEKDHIVQGLEDQVHENNATIQEKDKEIAELQATKMTKTTGGTTSDGSAYSGKTLTMESTAYSIDPRDSMTPSTITATGQDLTVNPMAVAVDPNVIPLGTRVYVEGYGEAIASDTGGAIKGNIIDVHFPTYEQCIQWGRRTVNVTIIG